MALPLTKYAQIQNKYLVAYFGTESDLVGQLIAARPMIERKFHPIDLYIGCRDSVFYLFENEPRIHRYSDIRKHKREFAYIRELKNNMIDNPVIAFLEECGVSHERQPDSISNHNS